jgi:menaquinol-cytochrome c reductase iron-sulfur subunit
MHHDIPPPSPERRSFLKWVTYGLSALFTLLLALPVVAYVLDPRNRQGRSGAFKTVARRSQLVPGQPTQVVVRDVRHDAWSLYPDDVLGRVWLVRRDDDDPSKKGQFHVDAYTTICPHLGCSVNYEPDKKLFICPCHEGTFDLHGKLAQRSGGRTNPPPRGMDTLECRPDPDNPDFIQVKYERFIQGTRDKMIKG